jgi:pyroglutamyl-peptidase
MEAVKRRLLISGFEPFAGEAINPSAELVRDRAWLQSSLPGFDVQSVLLPVTFQAAYEVLSRRVRELDPDVVIALGQAGGRDKLGLERVAINCLDAEIADNAGEKPVDEPIEKGGPVGLFATLPIRKMLDKGLASGIACEISNTAGTYVCNFLLYRLLEENRTSRRHCGFIHLPYLPEQAKVKYPAPPAMALTDMKLGLAAMLGVL